MTFKRKITTVIIVSQLICIPLAFIAVKNVRATNEAFSLVDSVQKEIELLNVITHYLSDFERGQKGYMLVGDDSYLEPYSMAEEKFNTSVENLILLTESEETKTQLRDVIQIKDEWIQKSSIPQMMAKKKLDRGLISNSDFIQTLKSFNDKETFGRIHKILGELKQKQITVYQGLSSESLAASRRSILMTVISIVSFILSLGVLMWLSARVTKQVHRLMEDLSRLLNSTHEKVNSLNAVATQLQDATTNQVAAIETTSSAATEISATVDLTTSNVNKSLNLTISGAHSAQDGAAVGNKLSAKLVDLRNSLNGNLDSIAKGFTAVEEFSDRIQDIKGMTKLINDIVFQTKLLSFNASVEAARAGEAGKGFSVVAEEVGRLSKISGDSAKKIEDTLTDAATEIDSITENNKKTLSEIKHHITSATEEILSFSESNLKAFSEIVTASSGIRSQIEDVLRSSQEQAGGIKHIEENMTQLNNVGQITSQSSLRTHEIVQQLSETMTSLNLAVESLRREFTDPLVIQNPSSSRNSLAKTAQTSLPRPLQRHSA